MLPLLLETCIYCPYRVGQPSTRRHHQGRADWCQHGRWQQYKELKHGLQLDSKCHYSSPIALPPVVLPNPLELDIPIPRDNTPRLHQVWDFIERKGQCPVQSTGLTGRTIFYFTQCEILLHIWASSRDLRLLFSFFQGTSFLFREMHNHIKNHSCFILLFILNHCKRKFLFFKIQILRAEMPEDKQKIHNRLGQACFWLLNAKDWQCCWGSCLIPKIIPKVMFHSCMQI